MRFPGLLLQRPCSREGGGRAAGVQGCTWVTSAIEGVRELDKYEGIKTHWIESVRTHITPFPSTIGPYFRNSHENGGLQSNFSLAVVRKRSASLPAQTPPHFTSLGGGGWQHTAWSGLASASLGPSPSRAFQKLGKALVHFHFFET